MIKVFDCDKHRWGDCDCTDECRRGAPEMGIMGIDPIDEGKTVSRRHAVIGHITKVFECNLQSKKKCSCKGTCQYGRPQVDEIIEYKDGRTVVPGHAHEIDEYDRHMADMKMREMELRKLQEKEALIKERAAEILFADKKTIF